MIYNSKSLTTTTHEEENYLVAEDLFSRIEII